MFKHSLLIGVLAFVVLTGCKKDDSPTSQPTPMTNLRLNFTGLQTLAGGYYYEGWAIINSQPVTTGKFNVGATGLVTLSGQAIPNGDFNAGVDLNTASAIVITIEPPGDPNPAPSSTHILGGSVSNGVAGLTVNHETALQSDFTTAVGKYILATPTDTVSTNEKSGVWFLQLPGGTAGLTLPALPGGWKYEGWVVANQPLTTGKFLTASGADQQAPYSGPNPGPPFPGEDFLRNAPTGVTYPIDLSGKTIVISVEPDPDDSPLPFTLKPLAHTAPTNAQDHVTFSMNNQAAATNPSGTATIK